MTTVEEPAVLTGELVQVPGMDLPELSRWYSTEELLDLLDDAAAADVERNRPTNTALAYNGDWKVWQEFTAQLGVDALTARRGLFYAFVKWLEGQEYAPSTIARRLYGTVVGLRSRGVDVPPKGPTTAAAERIRQYEVEQRANNVVVRRGKAVRGKAVPITAEQVGLICSRSRYGLIALRDRAILLLGIELAARRSEIANLLDDDIVASPRGLEVTIRVTKGGKGRTVAVPHRRNPLRCAACTWLEWRQEAGIFGGPAFCQIRGRLRTYAVPGTAITPQLVGQTVAKLGQLADLDLHLTGHSVRAGRVTALFEAGIDGADICDITGHSPKSGTVYDYRRPVDRWTNPALEVDL